MLGLLLGTGSFLALSSLRRRRAERIALDAAYQTIPLATRNAQNGNEMAPLMVSSVASRAVAEQKSIVGIVKIVREGWMELLLFVTLLGLFVGELESKCPMEVS